MVKFAVLEDYRIEDIPVPTPGPGEVLCKVPLQYCMSKK